MSIARRELRIIIADADDRAAIEDIIRQSPSPHPTPVTETIATCALQPVPTQYRQYANSVNTAEARLWHVVKRNYRQTKGYHDHARDRAEKGAAATQKPSTP